MIDFAWPWLLVLLPLPALMRHLLPPVEPPGAALRVPGRLAEEMLHDDHGSHPAETWRQSAPRMLLWALIVIAAAGPRQLLPVPALEVSGRDLAIALDLSGSMVRTDFVLDARPVSRLEAVQTVGAAFVRGRGGDRVALIVFGSQAYVAAPFTFDTEAVARRIEEAAIGISGRATNMSDALGLALSRMRSSQARARVVVLLSDGINNAGAAAPRDVARLARQLGITVHTIAMGPEDTRSSPDANGAVDAAALADIARISGGTAFRVRDMDDLREVMTAIDRLEAVEAEGLAAQIHRPLWVWPGAAAFLLALVQIRRSGA
ncbi:VWA domain-containing protein [Profundibacterium mesophilum]|uniref:von Willebrand domain containing protein n=1 Tax=Profundibacterium mesophilum KAUST100406-0324 TaxID=1037889 RepID=A0A921NT77_9RHOB|nr:VWA domain-containing protein [Profundibacterium mesophilum]KAF0674696.1 Von Willebrand domain containing protein [Profundibacterium mesophilum KAUST100406-0324]